MKKTSQRLMVATLVTGLSAGPIAPQAHAQDFPPPPDIDGFPAPADSGGGASPSSDGNHAADQSGLTKGQKEKFNRAGIEDVTNENFPETIESFDFPNVEITDVIKTISELTGKNFIIDPGVRGKITILAPSKLTVAEAYKAFLSALAINGYTVVPSGSFLKVKNARNAQRDSIETYSGPYYPNDDQMITRIIHLKHISAEIVNRELRILPSKDGEMSIYSPTNSIILSDYGANIDRVMKIINQLDVPGFEEQIEVVPIKNAKAKDMAELIDKIVNKGQKSNAQGAPGTFSSGVPRFTRGGGATAQGQSGNAFFMAIPDERTNSLIIVGNKSGIQRVKKLLTQLDFRIRPEDTGGVFVYYMKYGDAKKVAAVLQGVTKDAAPKTGPGAGPGGFGNFGGFGMQQQASTEIFGGDVKITADETTNSLVITASKPDYEQVLNLLSKVDIANDQVFVEATIMEMTVGDGSNWQIGYYQYGSSGYGKVGFNGNLDLQSLLSPTGGSGAIIGFGQGKTIDVTDPTTSKTLSIPSLIGFLTFLKSNTRSNILSNPQILAVNNQEALIEVGDKVPVSLTTTASTTGQSSVTANFEEATISLKIKPFISPQSDAIRMEIDQSVKQPTTIILPKALQDNTQPLATRRIKTNLLINSGDTAVLGGLMKDQEREKVTKVPLLGDLPIIGWLFKSRETSRDKVNLVVFLSPKILRSKTDMNQVIGKRLDERLDFIKAGGGRDPFGGKIDEIQNGLSSNKGAGTPSPALDDELFKQPAPTPAPLPPVTPPAQAKEQKPAPTKAEAPVPPPALDEPQAPAQDNSNDLDLPSEGGEESLDPALTE